MKATFTTNLDHLCIKIPGSFYNQSIISIRFARISNLYPVSPVLHATVSACDALIVYGIHTAV